MGRGRRGDDRRAGAAPWQGRGVALSGLTGALLLAALTGCGPDGTGPGEEASARTGPIRLADPIELAIVQDSAEAPCADDYLPGPEGEECFLLGESLRVTEVEQLEMGTPAVPDGAEEVLQLTLTDEDGAAFADLTTRAAELPEPRIAMLVAGEVVSAPTLAEPIPGGALQIAGWDGAEEFVAEAGDG